MSRILDPASPVNRLRQNRVRRWADRLGYRLNRSPARMLHADDLGWYQLEDVYSTTVACGIDYDLDLSDVETILQAQERYLCDLEQKLRLKQSARSCAPPDTNVIA
jgi:hypothetical protein